MVIVAASAAFFLAMHQENRADIVDGTDAVTLSVHDTGPGVAEADLGCVFDGFFTTKDTGMGIGLSICQSIIAEHGGEIGVTNHPAGGAMFRVSLPVGDDARPGG